MTNLFRPIFLLVVVTLLLPLTSSVNLSIQTIMPQETICPTFCVEDIQESDENSVLVSSNDGNFQVSWKKPFGNLIIQELILDLDVLTCNSLTDCSPKNHELTVEGWDSNSWQSIKSSKNSLKDSINVKTHLKFDGSYRARISTTAPYLKINQFSLSGDFSELQTSTTVEDILKDNEIFIRRTILGIIAILAIIFVALVLRRIFKGSKKQDHLSKQMTKYEKLSQESEDLEAEIKSVEDSRSQLQRKYYTREIGENTFKEMMQKYEQDRTKLKNKLSDLKKQIDSITLS